MKGSSVFFVFTTRCSLPLVLSSSRDPAKGGLARTNVSLFSSLALWSESESR